MSENQPTRREPSIDLATITADDLLLDALAAGALHPGDDAPAGDDMTAMLAAWRAEISADEPSAERDAELIRAAIAVAEETRLPARPQSVRIGRRLLGAAAAVVIAAGLALGGNHAGPTSPLWPIAKVVNPQQAEVRAAEYAIEQARAAALAGRLDAARRLLDEARTHVTRVRDPAVATRLRTDMESVLRDVPGMTPPLPVATPPAPVATPAPPAGPVGTLPPGAVPPPVPGGAPATTRITPAPEAPAPDRRVNPENGPALPVPTLLPAPEPSSLLSSLPDLPLPTRLLG
ncbi:anti-sigma-D factor RsdA [Micromonospora sp. NPDC049679]|uniref:anti-sigma-D factor RsdA n=1 Tax=Micromonospora sp. NPDC049679 TaxID=3155920 RepID=UPI0033F31AB9